MSAIGREATQRGAHGLMFVVGLALVALLSLWLATAPGPPSDWTCEQSTRPDLPCLDADAR